MLTDAALSAQLSKVEEARAKQTLYGVLTVLWFFPSFGACWIIGQGGQPWLRASSLLESLRLVSLEEWIAVGLLLAHLVFAWLTFRYRKMARNAGASALAKREDG